MGIAAIRSPHSFQLIQNHQYLSNSNSNLNSMSGDYHQRIFNFSNGFERSQPEQQQQQQHIAQQIRRDKLRVQGFEPPPPLVGIEEEESGGIPGYETAGMLSEMFNFPSGGGGGTATELLESQILQSYRNSRGAPPPDWFPQRQGMVVDGNLGDSKNHHQISSINADSAAAMQLFLINPHHQQRSPSPSPSQPPPPSTSSTLHMLLPNPSAAASSSTLQGLHPTGGAFGQFTWNESNPSEIQPGSFMEGQGQGLSLSLSSSLEAAKAEELRMREGGMLFFGHGGGSTPTPTATPAPPQYQFKHLGGGGGGGGGGGIIQNHQFGSSFGTVNLLRNSKYAKAAQELLEEFCSVGRGQFKRNKFNNNSGNPSSNPSDGGASKEVSPLSAADRIEHQRRKVKLLSMLEEVDRRYNHYCEQMQMVVNSFDMVMGFGAAVPYTCLAQKAMSRHFRCLKDAISEQLKNSCELLGEKDLGTSGVTKGETPRLRMLEQSLRQQRAFHQMGMMEQEAWRPQRGLPERSVNILRAWLFEHFLHPYPSDADKHLLARQTGLSRNQVSNWFINARVRLWKPMIEEMYQQEAKDIEDTEDDVVAGDRDQSSTSAQTPMPAVPATVTVTATSSASTALPATINAPENDHTFTAINRQCFTDNQASLPQPPPPPPATNSAASTTTASLQQSFPGQATDEASHYQDMESTMMRPFGTSTGGDVSLTLGLRHAGNLPEKSPFSVREFGGC